MDSDRIRAEGAKTHQPSGNAPTDDVDSHLRGVVRFGGCPWRRATLDQATRAWRSRDLVVGDRTAPAPAKCRSTPSAPLVGRTFRGRCRWTNAVLRVSPSLTDDNSFGWYKAAAQAIRSRLASPDRTAGPEQPFASLPLSVARTAPVGAEQSVEKRASRSSGKHGSAAGACGGSVTQFGDYSSQTVLQDQLPLAAGPAHRGMRRRCPSDFWCKSPI